MNTPTTPNRYGRPTAPRNKSWPAIQPRLLRLESELDDVIRDMANAGLRKHTVPLFKLLARIRLAREDIAVDQHRRPPA